MDKIQENNEIVSYKFFIYIPGTTFINKWGRPGQNMDPIYGYCTFNKETEEFILDTEESDPYFTEKSHEVIMAQVALIRKKRENAGYPPIIEIATG